MRSSLCSTPNPTPRISPKAKISANALSPQATDRSYVCAAQGRGLARSCFMCSALEVPVSGSIPTAFAKRKTTCASVALQRLAMPAISGCPRTSGLAVSNEKPW